jgi:glycosyltransferase involved in cell wall biosynthesis
VSSGARGVLVLSSTFPQFEADPRGAFIRRHWERHARGGRTVRALVPRNAWSEGTLETCLDVVRVAYGPKRWSTICGRFGILENLREQPLRAIQLPALWWALRRALRRELIARTPEVVVAHMLLPCGMIVADQCRAHAIPYELYGHGTDVDLVLGLPGWWRRRWARRLLDAQRVWFPSAEKLDRLVAGMGWDERPPHFDVETMVETVVSSTTPARVRREPVREPEVPTVLFMGRLIDQKGVDVLLRAVHHCERRVRVEIAGDGPERRRLERLAKKLDVDAHFHGFVLGAQRDELYRDSQLLCVPSRPVRSLSEGAPLVIVEAQAQGLPVVASSTGGIPELCVGRPDCALVPPDDPEALAGALMRVLGSGHDGVREPRRRALVG